MYDPAGAPRRTPLDSVLWQGLVLTSEFSLSDIVFHQEGVFYGGFGLFVSILQISFKKLIGSTYRTQFSSVSLIFLQLAMINIDWEEDWGLLAHPDRLSHTPFSNLFWCQVDFGSGYCMLPNSTGFPYKSLLTSLTFVSILPVLHFWTLSSKLKSLLLRFPLCILMNMDALSYITCLLLAHSANPENFAHPPPPASAPKPLVTTFLCPYFSQQMARVDLGPRKENCCRLKMVILPFLLLHSFLSGNRLTKVMNSQARLPRSHSGRVICSTLDNESSSCDPSFSLQNEDSIGPYSSYEEWVNVCEVFGPGPGKQHLH